MPLPLYSTPFTVSRSQQGSVSNAVAVTFTGESGEMVQFCSSAYSSGKPGERTQLPTTVHGPATSKTGGGGAEGGIGGEAGLGEGGDGGKGGQRGGGDGSGEGGGIVGAVGAEGSGDGSDGGGTTGGEGGAAG